MCLEVSEKAMLTILWSMVELRRKLEGAMVEEEVGYGNGAGWGMKVDIDALGRQATAEKGAW